MKKLNLSPERCLQLADMEGNHDVGAIAPELLMSGSERRLVLDLPLERQELLKAYAEGCYDRGVRLGILIRPIARPQWVANCMQDALDSIHLGRESWERIESVASLQNA